jgi:formiminotetrahydrofolate cyclodeaminase
LRDAVIKDESIEEFLDQLASRASTPGGGSAAAVMGAMGAALISMVCNLTIGKSNYAQVEDEMKRVLTQAEALRHSLVAMINADVQAFDTVMRAYALPRATEEEKAARLEATQLALKEATLVPLAGAKACVEVMQLSQIVAEKGNVNVISDAGVAVVAAQAALRSAALNVYINAKAIKDRSFAEHQLVQLDSILRGSDDLADSVYEVVRAKLS